jgi:hypothetical protein
MEWAKPHRTGDSTVAIGYHRSLRCLHVAVVWMGTCICCALAMICFYGLWGTGTIYSFKTHAEQGAAVLQTASAATLSSSWAIWFGTRRKRSLTMMILRTASATQASLTVYAIVGMQVATANWRSPFDFIFRPSFFAEYNWLTFIMEVAPVTSIAAGVLLLLSSILYVHGREERRYASEV